MNLFAYGTLMLPDLFGAVTGARKPSWEARLDDYGRFRLKGLLYPAVVHAEGRFTDGKVYTGLDENDMARLDAYEGEMYARVAGVVRLHDGLPECAHIYVLRESFRHLLTDEPWDPEKFRLKDRQAFLETYPGFGHPDRDRGR